MEDIMTDPIRLHGRFLRDLCPWISGL